MVHEAERYSFECIKFSKYDKHMKITSNKNERNAADDHTNVWLMLRD